MTSCDFPMIFYDFLLIDMQEHAGDALMIPGWMTAHLQVTDVLLQKPVSWMDVQHICKRLIFCSKEIDI